MHHRDDIVEAVELLGAFAIRVKAYIQHRPSVKTHDHTGGRGACTRREVADAGLVDAAGHVHLLAVLHLGGDFALVLEAWLEEED